MCVWGGGPVKRGESHAWRQSQQCSVGDRANTSHPVDSVEADRSGTTVSVRTVTAAASRQQRKMFLRLRLRCSPPVRQRLLATGSRNPVVGLPLQLEIPFKFHQEPGEDHGTSTRSTCRQPSSARWTRSVINHHKLATRRRGFPPNAARRFYEKRLSNIMHGFRKSPAGLTDVAAVQGPQRSERRTQCRDITPETVLKRKHL